MLKLERPIKLEILNLLDPIDVCFESWKINCNRMENKQAIDVRNNSLGSKAPCQEENGGQLQGNEVFSISDTFDGKSSRKET